MTEKPAACRYCRDPLETTSRGRPPRYCSTGCRRAAEYEVRRVSRRLESLEEQRDRLAVVSAGYRFRDAGVTEWQRRRHATEVETIAEQIDGYRRRLAELLNEKEAHT